VPFSKNEPIEKLYAVGTYSRQAGRVTATCRVRRLHHRYMFCCLTECVKKRKVSLDVRQQTRGLTLKALRRARADAGLTISELAKRAGVSRDTISKAERGLHSLQASTLYKVAQALGKAPSELLAEEERLVPKAESRSSFEPSLFDGAEEERRAVWEAAVDEARRLREAGWAQMWKVLSGWRTCKQRGEPYAARREFLDEMGKILEKVYDADVALGQAYIEAAFTQGGSAASGPSYLREESRTTSHFYGELLGLVKSAKLSVRTGADAAVASCLAAAEGTQPKPRAHSVVEDAA
jgi:transcriptional regulator with XRE-family HTH domain